MDKLNGKIALVAGGAGNVGEGIVRAFLKEGATVIVPSRDRHKLDRLHEYMTGIETGRLVTLVADIGSIEGAEQFRDEIMTKFGRIDAAVVSLGGAWREHLPITAVSMADWQQYLHSNLTSHFIAARTFLPVLTQTKNSTYTLIGGGAADTPFPNYSLIAIPAAGQLMLTRVLIEEMKATSVRINEIVIYGLMATRETAGRDRPEAVTTDEVGEFSAWLASDQAHMVSGSILRLYERTGKSS